MRIGLQLDVRVAMGAWKSNLEVDAYFKKELSEEGKLGKWLRMHDLYNDIEIMPYAFCVIVTCTEEQYFELKLGTHTGFIMQLITK